ncbi:hypothetical protein AVEN_5294-1 [Araneus ventricosus]|uniref:Uncharacterized protein n=1 Tax=Araneus ventricosus TaxID=182803 RepID=A0A4Y2CXK0_ARAVE|nr:hypothetical protein AVEN_5294-1 [Araneus ventricosus]
MGQSFNRKKHLPNPTQSFPYPTPWNRQDLIFATGHGVHLTKSTQDLKTIWWNKVMKNKLSRIKTRTLVKFLLDNESLPSPDPDSEKFLKKPPPKFNSSPIICVYSLPLI